MCKHRGLVRAGGVIGALAMFFVFLWVTPSSIIAQTADVPSAPRVEVAKTNTVQSTSNRNQIFAVGGSQVCGIDIDSGIRCWGIDTYGAVTNIDNGFGPTIREPSQIAAPDDAEGTLHFENARSLGIVGVSPCAVRTDDRLYCWGYLFDAVPSRVEGLGHVDRIEFGVDTLCASMADNGDIYCMTHVSIEQLGLVSGVPKKIVDAATQPYVDFAVGYNSLCILEEVGGAVECWGRNLHGQLGRGFVTPLGPEFDVYEDDFAPVINLTGVIDIETRDELVCALKENGDLYCWGDNSFDVIMPMYGGETPDPVYEVPTPTQIGYNKATVGHVAQLEVGTGSYCLLNTDGEAHCYLPEGLFTVDLGPAPQLSGITDLELGTDIVCGSTALGELICLGDDADGMRGVGECDPFAAGEDVSCNDIPQGTPVVGGAWLLVYGATIEGRIIDEYKAEENPPPAPKLANTFVVTMTDSSGDAVTTMTNSDGEFSFTGVITGAYMIEVESPRHDLESPDHNLVEIGIEDFGFTREISFTAGLMPDNGIRPEPGAFFFRNWGVIPGTPVDGDLNTQSILGLFGKRVCEDEDVADCDLTYAAEQWRLAELAEMENGHCSGMAMSAHFFHAGALVPSLLQEDATTPWELFRVPAVTNYIAQSHVLQNLIPKTGSTGWSYVYDGAGTPKDVLETIRTILRVDPLNPVYLGIKDKKYGAHALTPFRVERISKSVQRVYVYDSNYPGAMDHYVTFDTDANTWEYAFGSVNPDQPAVIWKGNAATKSLRLRQTTPVKNASQVASGGWACPFCVIPAEAAAAGAESTLLVMGDLLWATGDGGNAGWDAAKEEFVNSISGAELLYSDTGAGYQTGADLLLPASASYTLASTAAQEGAVMLTILGAGYGTGANLPDAEEGKTFQVTSGAGGRSIRYVSTGSGAAPALFILDDTGEEPYRVDLAISGLGTDDSVELVALADGNGWQLALTRSANGETHTFTSDVLPATGDVAVVMDAGAWNGNGDLPATVNGVSTMLPASAGAVWLPVVNR